MLFIWASSSSHIKQSVFYFFLGFPSFSIRGFLPVFDNLVLFSVSESACILYRKYHYNHSYPRTLTLTCDGVSIWSLKRRTNSNWWICLRIFVLCFQEQKTYEQIKAEIMASNVVEDDWVAWRVVFICHMIERIMFPDPTFPFSSFTFNHVWHLIWLFCLL